MNNAEVAKLANECDVEYMPEEDETGYVEYYALPPDKLLYFANACEKIGMEKAANICESRFRYADDANECAEAIRAHKE